MEYGDNPIRSVNLAAGTIYYRDCGTGPTLLFVHGLLVNGDVWRNVASALAGRYRCIVPTFPLGSHSAAMSPDADLTPPGLAKILADLIAELGLTNVTLIGNDTGSALCQLLIAKNHERIAMLVLTNGDAYENFLPPALRLFQYGAHVAGFVLLLSRLLRVSFARRLFISFVAKRRPAAAVLDSYLSPLERDASVRKDLAKVMRGVSNRYTMTAATTFHSFKKPVLVAWAERDFFFPFRYAERLVRDFPDATLHRFMDSRTLIPEDEPAMLSQIITEFVGVPAATPQKA
ncbi:MAG: alpha/beta fold hydrolase [Candidatus Elarobacter sp.]